MKPNKENDIEQHVEDPTHVEVSDHSAEDAGKIHAADHHLQEEEGTEIFVVSFIDMWSCYCCHRRRCRCYHML